ncbi:MvaI/BcnI family restriction endonuclease [uncultured Aquimarina sp.]|uniref:MvaI/BcnI family restriction endonuclease n=1 Tax=uncultured Aquimarina sp. TaxID=575652 RepID=UPI002637D8E5|nr:MvaI/BcnI family restriction endonuclease [uncultured Aquimarina sp.]
MRLLTNPEEEKLKVLTENSISLTLIEPTENGLKKSIMDATGTVRNYLRKNNFHDYNLQAQGPENKIIIDALIYETDKVNKSRTSLYRPKTKKGDPRIWFSGLTKYSNPNDILALIAFEGKLHVLNLTQLPIEQLIDSAIINPIKELIEEINFIENAVSKELLNMLTNLAKGGPILSMVNADTSVGRTLETALGIDINSSKLPDYKGIELKSFRANKGNRKNLFAQVPNWKLSKFKRSAEILNAFGYWREEDFKLYCTVSAITTNSQGLTLKVDPDINQLIENSNQKGVGDFVVWTLDKLHQRLLEKHKETFWVAADTIYDDGKEYFQYKQVEHTRKPIVSQFDILLEQGIITLDHLIKRNSKGRVVEKGPLFKIKPNSLDLLFPPSNIYNLIL